MGVTPVSDQTITQQVQNKLAGRGLSSPCHVTVETRKGEVTLSGSVQYAHQKGTAVQVANVISGVRRVIDRLIVKAVPKY
jgi:osmotically-inducible protein OsmY